MSEQSDTPRTDATQYQWTRTLDLARDLERELATATRERDEARAIANDRDAMVDHRDRALTAMYQCVDVITQERDEARAEIERLRVALFFVIEDADVWHDVARGGQSDNITADIRALAATEPKP